MKEREKKEISDNQVKMFRYEMRGRIVLSIIDFLRQSTLKFIPIFFLFLAFYILIGYDNSKIELILNFIKSYTNDEGYIKTVILILSLITNVILITTVYTQSKAKKDVIKEKAKISDKLTEFDAYRASSKLNPDGTTPKE